MNHKTVSTLLAALLLAAGAYAQGKKSSDDADQKELFNYVLSMDKVQKFSGVTKALQPLAKQHPEIQNDPNDAKSIDELVRKFQRYPDAVAVLSKNGFTPREYIVAMMTTVQATMAVGMKKSGMYKEYPPEMLKTVSKANLDFVDQHWDEFQKLAQMSSDDK
ncbi:MAG TPA: hypothetical protein VKB88_40615 [Bryobacteraceae bacterium]|nr:hypothetical protein [Bryobacteraceae bacterium]